MPTYLGKHLLDVTIASLALVLLSPIMLCAILLIWLSSPGPVLFRQSRAGYRGKEFTLLKFRSMQVHEPTKEQTHLSDPNVTRVGKLLRRFKVDELPQLWNILKGEMSLVGPRPTIPDQVHTYTPWQRRRLDVRPGLTGWAQVNGNIYLTWEERIRLDIWYIENQSFLLDLHIMWKTIAVVLMGERRTTETSS